MGSCQRIYWSETYFLVASESFAWWRLWALTDYWIVYDQEGNPRTTILANPYLFRLFGEPSREKIISNPWRPQNRGELLVFPQPLLAGICRVESMPERMAFPDQSCEQIGACLKAPALDLRKFQLNERESVGSFAWHPSGDYLAFTISGRLHLIHWNTGELVFLQGPPSGEAYQALEWSADGRLLALDSEVDEVWDAATTEIRAALPDEWWSIRPPGSLENKWISRDGKRRFSSGFYGNFPVELGPGITDVAWSPDPDHFATIGGRGCSRDIRVWKRST